MSILFIFGSPTALVPGKSTLLNVLCGELVPVPGPSGEAPGEAAPSVSVVVG